MGYIVGIWNRISDFWSKLSKSRKIAIAIVFCSLFAAILVYYLSFNKTEYVPVFTNLDIQGSSQIVAKLDERKYTNYKIADNGAAILVPKEDVDRLRLDLAIDGVLPDSGKGFELFDESSYAMTDADRKILYQRALQGELERSIQSLKEVEKARVHLALSEETIFMKEQKPATASIILDLKPNQSLSPQQIKGIISLVSGAVKNLPEENVRVVDSQANLLSEGVLEQNDPFQSPQGSNQLMDVEQQFEANIRNDLVKLLEQVFGPGKVVVAVKTDLDFNSEESTIISYNPQGIIRSQQVRINQNGSSTEGEGSSPIDNNTQNYIDDNIDKLLEQGGITSYESITNNEIGETTTYIRKAPGEIKRISASVVYDGTLNEQMKQAIENIAKAAIGYDAARGDTVHVEGVPFDTSLQDLLEKQMAEEKARAAEEAAKKAKEQAERIQMMVYAAIALLLVASIIIMIVLIRHGKKRKKDEQHLLDVQLDEPIPVDELLREQLINIEPKESTEELSIKEYAQKNPDEVADLVRAWILDDER